jgi:hypothetical protein
MAKCLDPSSSDNTPGPLAVLPLGSRIYPVLGHFERTKSTWQRIIAGIVAAQSPLPALSPQHFFDRENQRQTPGIYRALASASRRKSD